jgi:DNA polymerase-3 subunit delta
MNDSFKALTYSSLLQRLEKGEIRPAYFFFGEEEYLVERALLKIKEIAVNQSEEAFNWNLFYADADDMDWNLFADALTSLPLIPTRRVVVLKHCERLLKKKNALPIVENALQHPAEDLTLILIQSDPPDQRKKFYDLILRQAEIVAFPPLKSVELERYLQQYAKHYGKSISPDALQRILTDSQPDLRELSSKLDILISFAGEKPTIEPDDVESCTAFTREVGVYNLLDALGRKDAVSARRIAEQLIQRKIDIGGLIPLLYRQVWTMYRMKYLQDQRVPNSKWKEKITVKPAFLERRYRGYLSRYSRRQLGKALEVIAEADIARKSTSVQDDYLLRTLTEQLLSS